MPVRFNTTIRDANATSVVTEAGTSAVIRIYQGTQPANPAASIGASTVLATLAGNATQFGTVTGGSGTVTLSAIAAVTASATGTAQWFRVFKSNGTTAVLDGSAGTSGTDLILNTASFTSGGSVSITSGSIAMSPD